MERGCGEEKISKPVSVGGFRKECRSRVDENAILTRSIGVRHCSGMSIEIISLSCVHKGRQGQWKHSSRNNEQRHGEWRKRSKRHSSVNQ